MKQILSEVAALSVATVLIGMFAISFKTDKEREQILQRVSEVTRPITQLVGA